MTNTGEKTVNGWSEKVTNSVKTFGNRMVQAVQSYSLDRLVWCLVTIGFCWSEVQNYHRYIFWQQMYLMAALGVFYCIKLGCFSKYKRIMCLGITWFGISLTLHLVEINFFADYYYLNVPIGVLATVLLNFVALVIWNIIQKRRFYGQIGPAVILMLMFLMMQTSIYDYKRFYFYILLGLIPFVLMKKGIRTRSCVLNGILDGLCIGFFIVQGYAWIHRPYNYSKIRYTGISNACTEMSRIYLVYFATWMIRYVQNARKKINIWNGISRVFCWFMAVFVLALEYLTGSRSAVLAIILMTVIATAVRHMDLQKKRWENLIGLLLWPINCACIGILSLALFPTAYASVRYLPAYFNAPDYVDAVGYRLQSKPIEEWGENFQWNFEYDEYAIKQDDDVEHPLYASFAESVTYNLGRIIPGVEEYLEEAFSNQLLEAKLNRIEYYLEQEIYTQIEYGWDKEYYISLYVPEELEQDDTEISEENAEDIQNTMQDDDFEEPENAIVRIYKTVMEKILSACIVKTDVETLSENTFVQLFEKIIDEYFSGLLVSSDAEEMDALWTTEESEEVVGERGDSPEYPWYTEEEYPGNGMELRNAIHEYAISKLNNEGHAAGSFNMWVTSENVQPHAHNIFLIMGYDFGIPTMILMILLFISVAGVSLYNVIRFGKIEYLFPLLLVAAMTMFGWFESGFNYKSMEFCWICLCSVFTDVIRVKKKTDKTEMP